MALDFCSCSCENLTLPVGKTRDSLASLKVMMVGGGGMFHVPVAVLSDVYHFCFYRFVKLDQQTIQRVSSVPRHFPSS